ncbi:MAG: choice-of-anchor tandem repeat NxxGxxAF-containing protein [Planctomycetota bacterium]
MIGAAALALILLSLPQELPEEEGVASRPLPLAEGFTPFRFAAVAETQHGRFTEFLGPPTVNAAGVCAFVAVTTNGATGIFTGSGGPPIEVASSDAEFDSFAPWALITDKWQVLFQAKIERRGSGLFLSEPARSFQVVADTLRTFTRFDGVPAMNPRGDIAFYAQVDERLPAGVYIPEDRYPPVRIPEDDLKPGDQLPHKGDRPPEGIFVQDLLGKTVVAVDTLNRYRRIEPSVALSYDGTLVFVGTARSGETAVYVQARGGAVRALVTNQVRFEKFGPPVINDRGFVAFWSELKSGEQGVYLAQSGGGYLHEFLLASPERGEKIDSVISLERYGTVAYVHRRQEVPTLTFRRGKLAPMPLLSAKRSLPTGIVKDIRISSQCIGMHGHVAFFATFENGVSGIYLAVPLE